MAMFYGSPVLAAAVVGFVVHAWRQNSTTPIYGTGQGVGQAELGQVASFVAHAWPVYGTGQAWPTRRGWPGGRGSQAGPADHRHRDRPTRPGRRAPAAPTQTGRDDNVYPLPATSPRRTSHDRQPQRSPRQAARPQARQPPRPPPRRRQRRRPGRALLLAAVDYWRATCKRAAPEDRAAHRQRLADLIVSDADEWVDDLEQPDQLHPIGGRGVTVDIPKPI
jgi:hypothetical protein